jgi:hypothetical protein
MFHTLFWLGGGIGRRAGLKIQYPQGCESSSLSRATKKNDEISSDFIVFFCFWESENSLFDSNTRMVFERETLSAAKGRAQEARVRLSPITSVL